MTSSLPQDVRDVFERFVTTEYTTVDAGGQPITWPVTPYYEQGGGVIEITTGLGYPKKAKDARRNPHTSLLFSDPTGSGIESGIAVLVQGMAEVDDGDLDANRERYWRESWEKLPGVRDQHPPKALRGMFGWYYTRIYVRVRPERVFVWPEGDPTSAPVVHDSHLEEVRSGHSEEPASGRAAAVDGVVVWDERIAELGRRHPTAVLSWIAPDGFPLSVRMPVAPDPAARLVRIDGAPAGMPLSEGLGCLTAHAHSESFSWQENFQVRGDLVPDGDGWAVRPRRLVGGFELPNESAPARYRRNAAKMLRFYRTARRELAERRRREA